jgi:hypothetical protein
MALFDRGMARGFIDTTGLCSRRASDAKEAATKSRRRAENPATASQHGHDTQPATNVSMRPK